MGVDDRDWMRVRSIYGWMRPEYAHAATKKDLPLLGSRAAVYPRRRPRRSRVLPVALLSCAIGVAAVPAWHRFDARYVNPGPKPPTLVRTHVRVWVPAAKYGHVKVVPVRVLVPAR